MVYDVDTQPTGIVAGVVGGTILLIICCVLCVAVIGAVVTAIVLLYIYKQRKRRHTVETYGSPAGLEMTPIPPVTEAEEPELSEAEIARKEDNVTYEVDVNYN
eukprot:TRINITY_DN7464_c0_g1_i1.p1 TRINITY_DN7464_c0_g1~~TRINITY_DN7464_c0_g1_i1.p1  ORF type:complete len:103 (-),score=21.61 TRINITY_DN7464_c0_g1_i1:23-331(-)